MSNNVKIVSALIAMCLMCACAHAETTREKWLRQTALCDQGKWAEAKALGQEITRDFPDHGFGWVCLAWAEAATGQPREAIMHFNRALELGALSPHRIHLEIARAQMALGDREAAFAALDKMVAAGGPSRQRLQRDARFAPLADDARFKAIALNIDVSGLSREQGWRADIDLLAAEMKRLHYRPFRTISEAAFDAELSALKDALATQDDDAIIVRLMQILQPVADGHTQLLPLYRQGETAALLPLRMECFEEGLYVTAVPEGREALLWARLERIDDTPAATALERIAGVIPRDNTMWVKARAPSYLRFPQIMKPLGITRYRDRASFTLTTRAGKTETVNLEIGKPPAKWIEQPTDLAERMPRYRQKRDDNYWFEPLPGGVVYFQFNDVQNKRGGSETLAAIADRLVTFMLREKTRTLIIDLRWNGGGNLQLHLPLVKALLASPAVNRPGGLYLIVGRHTFSAAQVFAGQMERFSHAVFVGEPTGSSPNFIGENSELTLPYSKMRVSISPLYWQSSFAQDARSWIAPDLPTRNTFADWAAGRDAPMAAVMKAITSGTNQFSGRIEAATK